MVPRGGVAKWGGGPARRPSRELQDGAIGIQTRQEATKREGNEVNEMRDPRRGAGGSAAKPLRTRPAHGAPTRSPRGGAGGSAAKLRRTQPTRRTPARRQRGANEAALATTRRNLGEPTQRAGRPRSTRESARPARGRKLGGPTHLLCT